MYSHEQGKNVHVYREQLPVPERAALKKTGDHNRQKTEHKVSGPGCSNGSEVIPGCVKTEVRMGSEETIKPLSVSD